MNTGHRSGRNPLLWPFHKMGKHMITDSAFREIGLGQCPVCGERIHLAMRVNTDTGGVPSHPFWGERGNRWAICQRGAWFHFRVVEDGRNIHRLAYLMKKAMEPSPEAKPAPEDNPVQMKLGGGITIQQT